MASQSKVIVRSVPSDSFTTDLFKLILVIETLFVANWLGAIAETFFSTSAAVGCVLSVAALFPPFVVAEVSVLPSEVASPAVLAGVVVVPDVLPGVALVFGCVSLLLGDDDATFLPEISVLLLGVALVFGCVSLLDNATSVPEISVLLLGVALVFGWLPVPVVPVCVSPSALTVVAPPNINPPKTTLPTINEAAPPPFFFFLIEYFNFLFRLFLDTTSLIPLFNIWYLIKNNNQFYSSNLILFFLYFYFSKNKANLKSSYQLPLSKFTFSCDCLIIYVHIL